MNEIYIFPKAVEVSVKDAAALVAYLKQYPLSSVLSVFMYIFFSERLPEKNIRTKGSKNCFVFTILNYYVGEIKH